MGEIWGGRVVQQVNEAWLDVAHVAGAGGFLPRPRQIHVYPLRWAMARVDQDGAWKRRMTRKGGKSWKGEKRTKGWEGTKGRPVPIPTTI